MGPKRLFTARLNHYFSSLLFCLLGWGLAGCASLLQKPVDAEVLNGWSGRFALTVIAPDRGEQRTTGNFSLTEAKSATLLELSTPLGLTIASARVDTSGATLVTADGKRFDAANVEELTEQLFGWRIPIQRLPAWLAAKPAQVTEFVVASGGQDSERLPLSAKEDGWSIRYEVWNNRKLSRILISFPDRVTLRMVLSNDTAP